MDRLYIRHTLVFSDGDLTALADALRPLLTENDGQKADEPEPSGFLNTKQAADRLACSRQRIYDLVAQRLLPVYKEGGRSLYLCADVDKLVERAWPRHGPV